MFELASVGELPLPRTSPPATNKRDRDSDRTVENNTSPGPEPSTASSSPASFSEEARSIAGSKRVSTAVRPLPQSQQPVLQHVPSLHDAFLADDEPVQVGTSSSIPPSGVPPTATSNTAPTPFSSAFPAPLGGWYGYDGADSHTQQTPTALYGSGSATTAAQPSSSSAHGTATAAPNASFQGLDVGHMFTTQSMMYDQVLSNLSASLGQPPPGQSVQYSNQQQQQSHDFRQHPQQQQLMRGTATATTQDGADTVFEDLLASFGEDYAAMFPDFNTDGTLGFSTWPNNMAASQQGFGWVVS